MQTARGVFVAPDNGLLSYVQRREPDARVVVLENQQYWRDDPSHTFHGRDIFSPVAAHLAAGAPFDALGPPCDDLKQMSVPRLSITPGAIRGQVVRVDRFGNILTNIATLRWISPDTIEFVPHDAAAAAEPLTFAAASARVATGWHNLQPLNHTYGEAAAGQPLALISSGGELEIAVNQSSAGDKLGLKVGDPVSLYIES
jgi:S-adenosylmethionine hydrolase